MSDVKMRARFEHRMAAKPKSLKDLTRWNFSQSRKKNTDREAQRQAIATQATPVRWNDKT